MGLIKGMMFFAGVPVHPKTTRERARGYQRQANRLQDDANRLLAEQVHSLEELNSRLQKAQSQNARLQPKEQEIAKPKTDKLELIGKLHELRTAGVLTEEEFSAQKSAILKSI